VGPYKKAIESIDWGAEDEKGRGIWVTKNGDCKAKLAKGNGSIYTLWTMVNQGGRGHNRKRKTK